MKWVRQDQLLDDGIITRFQNKLTISEGLANLCSPSILTNVNDPGAATDESARTSAPSNVPLANAEPDLPCVKNDTDSKSLPSVAWSDFSLVSSAYFKHFSVLKAPIQDLDPKNQLHVQHELRYIERLVESMSLHLGSVVIHVSPCDPETVMNVRNEIDRISVRRQIIVAFRHQYRVGPPPEDLDGQRRCCVSDYLMGYELGVFSRGKWPAKQESSVEATILAEPEYFQDCCDANLDRKESLAMEFLLAGTDSVTARRATASSNASGSDRVDAKGAVLNAQLIAKLPACRGRRPHTRWIRGKVPTNTLELFYLSAPCVSVFAEAWCLGFRGLRVGMDSASR